MFDYVWRQIFHQYFKKMVISLKISNFHIIFKYVNYTCYRCQVSNETATQQQKNAYVGTVLFF